MKKKLTLWILCSPFVLFAQTIDKNGTITFDFGHKKPKVQDTVQQHQQKTYEDADTLRPKKEKKWASAVKDVKEETEAPDYKKDGIFKALVHVGFNGCQIDGDGYRGYNYLGFQGGAGALVRFHNFFSASMEINYTMKGAKQAFIFTAAPQTLQKYRAQLDYIEIPVALNVHAKFVMLSGGLAFSTLIRYKEQYENGDPASDGPGPPPGGWPNKFDLSGFIGLHFIIHKNFVVGGKFSYSITRIRDPQVPALTHLNGEYHNDLTIRFMYIIDTVKKRKG